MPSATDFRRAFGLEPGARISNQEEQQPRRPTTKTASRRHSTTGRAAQPRTFTLASVCVGHEVVAQNERYAFPMTLELEAADGEGKPGEAGGAAAQALRSALGGRVIVHSAFGSPYECFADLETLKIDADASEKLIHVKCRGIAMRRRDLPTKAQAAAAAASKTAAGDANAKSERKRLRQEAEGQGMRVTTSRFGSGSCPTCGVVIAHGELIARPTSIDTRGARGGWAHVACVLAGRSSKRQRAGKRMHAA